VGDWICPLAGGGPPGGFTTGYDEEGRGGSEDNIGRFVFGMYSAGGRPLSRATWFQSRRSVSLKEGKKTSFEKKRTRQFISVGFVHARKASQMYVHALENQDASIRKDVPTSRILAKGGEG